jgi:hypothetical protein
MSDSLSESVYLFIKYSMLIGITFGFTVLLVCSILVHDTNYITKNPKFFVSETLLMAILTTIPVAYLSYLRGGNKNEIINGSGLIFLKIILLHIGFQLTGIYSILFPNSA